MTNGTGVEVAVPTSWVRADEAGKRALAQARSRTLWQAISDAAALDPNRDALAAADDAGIVQRLNYGGLLSRVRNFSAADIVRCQCGTPVSRSAA